LDANRLSQGQLVAAVSAIALFIISFLPWFGLSGFGGSANRNMWEFENPLDIYLLIVILVALVPAAATFLGGGSDYPLAPFATTLLAGVGTLLLIYQLFDHGDHVSIKIGLILGIAATIGITVGGWLSMQEDVGGERY
jgi:hypothetical protein